MLQGGSVEVVSQFSVLTGNEVPETSFVSPASYSSMKLPLDLFCGSDDDQHGCMAPERRLYLAVFHFAFEELIGDDRRRREEAIDWFLGAHDSAITFEDVHNIFNFSQPRLKVIEECIEDPRGFIRNLKVRPNHRLGR